MVLAITIVLAVITDPFGIRDSTTAPPALTLDRTETLVTGGSGGVYYLDHPTDTFKFTSASGRTWDNDRSDLQFSTATCRGACTEIVLSPNPSQGSASMTPAWVVDASDALPKPRSPKPSRVEVASTRHSALTVAMDRDGRYRLLDEALTRPTPASSPTPETTDRRDHTGRTDLGTAHERATYRDTTDREATIIGGHHQQSDTTLAMSRTPPREWSVSAEGSGVIVTDHRNSTTLTAISTRRGRFVLDASFVVASPVLSACRLDDRLLIVTPDGVDMTTDGGRTSSRLALEAKPSQCLSGPDGVAFIERSATAKGIKTRIDLYNQDLESVHSLDFDDEALISLSPCDARVAVTAYNEVTIYGLDGSGPAVVPGATQALFGVDNALITVNEGRIDITPAADTSTGQANSQPGEQTPTCPSPQAH